MLTLALSPEGFNAPLIEAIASHLGESVLMRSYQRAFDAEWQLREGECDLALVSPLVFAYQQADFSFVPDAAIAAVSATGDLLLVFKPGLHHFETLAVRAADGIDAMLAQIILREKFHMHPRSILYKDSPEQALESCDAVLVRVHDDDGFLATHVESIDLIDEWFDMVQLPLLRQVFIGWDRRLIPDVCDRLAAACAEVDARSIDSLREQLKDGFAADSLHAIPGHYRYFLDDEAIEGLNRFFQLAYFHGLHRDIPAFKIWAPETSA
jgi:predicted solute-binding protein